MLVAERSSEGFERCMDMFSDVLDATLALGGTITGEHGVGQLKRGFLEREMGPTNLELQRAIKRAIDPKGRFVAGGWLERA